MHSNAFCQTDEGAALIAFDDAERLKLNIFLSESRNLRGRFSGENREVEGLRRDLLLQK